MKGSVRLMNRQRTVQRIERFVCCTWCVGCGCQVEGDAVITGRNEGSSRPGNQDGFGAVSGSAGGIENAVGDRGDDPRECNEYRQSAIQAGYRYCIRLVTCSD